MPVSVVCETAASVNAALRESLGSGGSCSAAAKVKQLSQDENVNNDSSNNADDIHNLHGKLIASAKKVLLSKIEYEEVSNYGQSVLDSLKSKYIVMNPSVNINCIENGRNSPATCNNGANGDSAADANCNNTSVANGSVISCKKVNPNELPAPKRILYPRENVRVGWKGTGRRWEVGVGMMNVGNTCYLNSTLQALFHVPSMANWLMSDSAHMERCEAIDAGCIICAMVKTLQESQKSQSAIKPYCVYSKLKSICKHLVMGRQEDAHEFLRYLVEAMEKSYLARFRNFKELDQYSKETTPLNQILGGYLKSAVRCLACNHISVTFQHFQDLLLDIRKADTVDEALEGYFSRERLEDMGYKCEACKKKVSATKQFSLERAPIALCIQLKRFSMLGTKLNKQITIKPKLDLSKFSSRKNPAEQLTYRLVAMVTHLGASQHCGHYTAIGLTESGTYYNYDDSFVRPISIQNVCNTNAYIIFYEMDTQISKVINSTQVNASQLSCAASTANQKEMQAIKMNGFTVGGSQRIIGPQLLPSYATNSTLNGGNISHLANGGSKFISTRNSTLVPPNSLISPSAPSNGGCSKTMINFKNNCTNISNNSVKTNATTSNNSASASSTSNCSTFDNLKNSNNNHSAINGLQKLESNKFQESGNTNFHTLSVPSTKGKINKGKNCNESSSDDIDEKEVVTSSSSQTQTAIKATLPSMPKLCVESTNSTSIVTNGFAKKSPAPIKSLVPYGSETDDEVDVSMTAASTYTDATNEQQKRLLPNPLKRRQSSSSWSSSSHSDNDDNANDNSIKTSNNVRVTKAASSTNSTSVGNILKSPPKGSDSVLKKSDTIDEIFNSVKRSISTSNANSSITLLKKKTQNQQFNVTSANTTIDRFSSDSEDETQGTNSSTIRTFKNSHSTPPSPPVVKTNSGIWQVTSLQPVTGPIIPTTTSTETTAAPKNPKNPFATKHQITTDNLKRLKKETSAKTFIGNGYQRNAIANESAVSELLRQSHRGYGAPVLSWNGQQSEIDKQIISEAREQRQRDWEDEEENEMDRGRQKKIKGSKEPYATAVSSGYNPFQEHENQKRWKRYHYVGSGGGCYRNNFQRNKFKFQRFQNKYSKKNMGGGGGNSSQNVNRRNDS